MRWQRGETAGTTGPETDTSQDPDQVPPPSSAALPDEAGRIGPETGTDLREAPTGTTGDAGLAGAPGSAGNPEPEYNSEPEGNPVAEDHRVLEDDAGPREAGLNGNTGPADATGQAWTGTPGPGEAEEPVVIDGTVVEAVVVSDDDPAGDDLLNRRGPAMSGGPSTSTPATDVPATDVPASASAATGSPASDIPASGSPATSEAATVGSNGGQAGAASGLGGASGRGAADPAAARPTAASSSPDQRWPDIVSLFVDDPRASVNQAAAVAADTVAAFVESLQQEQARLRASLDGADTEQLRAVLQQYRALCGRLAGIS